MSASSVTRSDLPLSPKQRALVDAIAHAADEGIQLTREAAGTAAGYGSGECARVAASRALALPHVKAALMVALRNTAQANAANALAMLRHLGRHSTSERVKLDASLTELRIAGLDQPEQAHQGAAVAVQIVFRTDAGTILTQAQHMHAQPQVISHVEEIEHSLAEGGAEPSQAEGVGGGDEPEAAKRGGGSKTSARRSPPAPPRNSPPKKPRVKKKLSRKVAAKVSEPVVSAGGTKGRRLNLSDEERARRSEAAKARNAARAAAKAGG